MAEIVHENSTTNRDIPDRFSFTKVTAGSCNPFRRVRLEMLVGNEKSGTQIPNLVLSCLPNAGRAYCVAVAPVNDDSRLELMAADYYSNNLPVPFDLSAPGIGLDSNIINMVWPFPSSGSDSSITVEK
jgi:hypothetical protein